MKNWNNITVEEYQLIYGIINDTKMIDFEKEVKLISIVNEISEKELDTMPIDKFKKLKSTLDFLHNGKIEGKLKPYVYLGKDKYKMSLDAFRLTYGQYVDITTFLSGDSAVIENLHLIMASLALPIKKNWYGKETVLDYGQVPHEDTAKKMLKSNFADCYHTSLFFLKLINALIKAIGVYSVKQILKDKRVTKAKLKEILKPLKNVGGGFTMPNLSQNLSE
jgi:hypothetical protein